MLHHVSVGVSDVGRAIRFYDAALGALGYKRVMEFMPFAVAYGDSAPSFWVQLPSDQKAASSGNGTHIGFNAKNQAAVRAFHDAALKEGGADEGAPGPRPEYSPNYYGAFVRDLDGNKIEAVYYAVAAAGASSKPEKKTKAEKKLSARRKSASRSSRARKAKKSAKQRARKR